MRWACMRGCVVNLVLIDQIVVRIEHVENPCTNGTSFEWNLHLCAQREQNNKTRSEHISQQQDEQTNHLNSVLDSLYKASELHFARTGKPFKVDEVQLSSRGPLEEIEKGWRHPFYQRRFTPYPQPCDLFRHKSPSIMFKTETETDFSSTKLKHLDTGPGSVQASFLSDQLKGWTYEEPKSMGIKQGVEQELLSLIEEKDAQNIRIDTSQGNRIHADKSVLKAPRMDAVHSYSAFPPRVFKQNQFEIIQHRLPNMNEVVQNFIDEAKLLPKVPLLTLAKEQMNDDVPVMETASDLFQDLGGDLRDELGVGWDSGL